MAAKEKKRRPKRTFSPEYKGDIVRQARAYKRGELAPLLAREGLTNSLLAAWRRELGGSKKDPHPPSPAGTQGRRSNAAPDAKTNAPDPDPATGDAEWDREIARWLRKIHLAEAIIEAKKRLREMEAEFDRG
jgi:transposase-like protein